jgi:hypothetical protein
MTDTIIYVMCAPLSECAKAPKDQVGARIEECPICSCSMWVSDRKRALRASSPMYKVRCAECIIRDQIRQGLDPRDLQVTDLLRMN